MEESQIGYQHKQKLILAVQNCMKPLIRILHLEDNQNDAELVKETLLMKEINCEIIHVDNEKSKSVARRNGMTLDKGTLFRDFRVEIFRINKNT